MVSWQLRTLAVTGCYPPWDNLEPFANGASQLNSMQVQGYSTRRYNAQKSHPTVSRSVRSEPRSRMPHSRRPQRQSVLRHRFHRGQFDRRNSARNQLRESKSRVYKFARCHQSHVQSHPRAQADTTGSFLPPSCVQFRILQFRILRSFE